LTDSRDALSKLPALIVAGALCLTATVAAAKEEIEQEPEEYCGLCEAKKRFHELTPWLKMGMDFRFRHIYQDNRRLRKDDATGDRNWQRYRGRLWASVTPIENLEFNIRLAAEPRYFFKPDSMDPQYIRDEALFDQFNIKWTRPGNLPVTVTTGRQDMRLGDGWLITRGTPRDGSRTNFFDAIRTTLHFEQAKTDLDLIYLRNHANSSWFIRPFHDRDLDLSEQDETGVIVYGSNKSLSGATIDGYFIYKHDDRVAADGNNADIYTFGGRIDAALSEKWKATAEIAPQFGRKNGVNIDALGANAKLSYHLKDKLNNCLRMAYEYRSGDSRRDGAFDILWGRWAQWSDAFIGHIDTIEGQSHRAANIHRVNFGWSFDPTEKTTVLADYHLLFADRNTFSGTAGFSQSGPFRGHLLTALLKYKFSHHLSGHLKGEVFFPGNYYDHTRNDPAVYIQYELVFSW